MIVNVKIQKILRPKIFFAVAVESLNHQVNNKLLEEHGEAVELLFSAFFLQGRR